MNFNNPIFQGLSFVVYLALQIIFIQNIVLFNSAFCFLYISFLILLPTQTNSILAMFLGFFMGLSVDIFVGTLGIHAAACVFVMFFRPMLLNFIKPFAGYDQQQGQVTINSFGLQWFASYAFLFILFHHLFLLFVEANSWILFFDTLLKAVASTVLTFITLILVQYLFYKK